MEFATFMTSSTGRAIRIVAGLALVLTGIFLAHSLAMIALIVVGLVPFLAGIFNVCVFAPLFGGPFDGRKLG